MSKQCVDVASPSIHGQVHVLSPPSTTVCDSHSSASVPTIAPDEAWPCSLAAHGDVGLLCNPHLSHMHALHL